MSSTKLNTSQWLGIAKVLGALSDFHHKGVLWVPAPDLYEAMYDVPPSYVIHSVTDAINLGYVEERMVTTEGKVTNKPNGGFAEYHLKPGGYVARVIEQKLCDSCLYDRGEIAPAFADARPKSQMRWGSFCIQCFVELECTLGTGFGQVYLVRPID